MAKYHGKSSKVYINTGSWVDVSADTTSVEVNGQADTVDVSGFTAATKTYVVGLADGQVRAQFTYDDAAGSVHALLSPRVGSSIGWRFMPSGSTNGLPLHSGSMIVSEYSVSSGISAAVTANVNLVPDSGSIPVWGTVA